MFDGSNTVSVQKDIILDNGVRFVVKKNTSGTLVACHEMKACDNMLSFLNLISQLVAIDLKQTGLILAGIGLI